MSNSVDRIAETVAGWRRKAEEERAALLAWEAEHPEMAAAWSGALVMDAARTAEREAAKAAETARRRVETACLVVGVPLRALKALDAAKGTEATQALPRRPEGAALLSGPPGTGKTVAACRIVRLAMQEAVAKNPERTAEMPERVALFARAVTLARASAYGPETQETLERVTSTRLLVLDDLGSEFASPVWDMLLFEILDVRHGAMLPTLITTNLGRDKLKERYGQRLVERVREGGEAHFLNGESMRGQS